LKFQTVILYLALECTKNNTIGHKVSAPLS